jgi:hypothetical protein
MTRQERLDIGEKIFVGVFVGSVVIEVLLTLLAITLNPAWNTLLPWTIVVLGAVFVAFLLYLANWLYSGNRTAWTAALGFAGFQIALAAGVIVAMLTSHRFAAYLGESLIWLAVAKAVAYAAFAGFLSLPKAIHDFLGLRRGETIPDETPAVVEAPPVEVPAGPMPLPLVDDQVARFGSLSTWMQLAGGLLIAAGLLRFYVGLASIEPALAFRKWLPGLPAVLEGIAATLFGIYLFLPAAVVKRVQNRDMSDLLKAFKNLQQLYSIQLIVLAVAVVAVALGIVAAFL